MCIYDIGSPLSFIYKVFTSRTFTKLIILHLHTVIHTHKQINKHTKQGKLCSNNKRDFTNNCGDSGFFVLKSPRYFK